MIVAHYTKFGHKRKSMLWRASCKGGDSSVCAGVVVFIFMLLFNMKYLSCRMFLFFYSFQGRVHNNFPFHIQSMKVDAML